jgi:membrane fusion protein (multidrug efflux system)
MSKRIGTFIILGLIILFSYMGYSYLSYRAINAVSDAAFIKSDNISILSFKVSGKVIDVKKLENQEVKKGELLAKIDEKDLKIAQEKILFSINSLKKSIEALELKKDRLEKSLELQNEIAKIDINAIQTKKESLISKIKASKVQLKQLTLDLKRYKNMLSQNLIASIKYENIKTNHEVLSNQIKAMEKNIDELDNNIKKAKKAYELTKINKKEIKELEASIQAQKENLNLQLKSLEDINNKIEYTKLYAPFDGIIAKKFTSAPRVVKEGSPIYALADPNSLYCEVLLSEKKMHGIKKGNEVSIKVDAIEDKTYKGTVESISPTSASTFSLVPRDIASGEFTKLDQRFAIRIKLNSTKGLLAGMGATVAIKRD